MLSRRGFILTGAAAAGGLVVAYGYRALDDGDASLKFAGQGAPAAPLNAWLKIAPDSSVICGIHRAEMGQSIVTTLAMLLAEELDADWNDVRFEFVPVDKDYYNFGMLLNGQPLGDPNASWGAATGTWAMRQVFNALGMSMTISSSSTIDAWDTLRPAGAAARQMLLQAAARRWSVAPDTLQTRRSRVINRATGDELSFGELAEAASREMPPDNMALKQWANYTLVGHNVPRLDTAMKTNGTATFGLDVSLPGMRYAAVVHSPVAGTTVASYDADEARTMPGLIQVVEAGKPGDIRAVAVVADNSWQALQAAAKLRVAANPPAEPADSRRILDDYRRLLDSATPVIFTDTAADARGDDESLPDFDARVAAGPEVITADYTVPFLAHACMEPMNCTALFTGNALELWAPTQAHSVARDIAANMAGLANDQVTVHTTFLGGGFGRRAEMDFVEQAVAVAMAQPDVPVKVFWSREQDIRHDAFRPAAVARFRGQLDEQGELSALDYTLVTQSVVASYETRTPTPRGGTPETDKSVVEAINPPVYPVANLRLGFVPADLHVPAGYWRSVAHSWTTFFIESFIDELAAADETDPLAFRMRLLRDRPRHRGVLQALKRLVYEAPTGDNEPTRDSGPTAGSDYGIGFSIAESHATVVAHAIEVATKDGEFDRVTRVVTVVDCGPVIHPDNVIAQMEGSVVDGLSAALYGSVEFREGRAVPGNFDTYRRLRLDECPEIHVHIIESSQQRPGGIGEPGVPGVAPALTNAIFAATGRRIRTLPLR